MEHSGGVSWIDEPVSIDHFKDMDSFAELLARQPHNFNGNKTRAYHAHTRGWYLNEIVRRVDPQHRTIGQIVSQEINEPYGVEWFYNPEPDLDGRISKPYHTSLFRLIKRLITPDWLYTVAEPLPEIFTMLNDKTTPMYKSLVTTGPDQRDIIGQHELVVRRYESPSTNGHTNARSVGSRFLHLIIVD